MYKTYEALVRGENFEANARNWMDANLPNPFEEGSEAHKLYFKAHQYCVRWRRGGIDCRSGKKYMFAAIHKIIDMGTPNPYSPKDVFPPKKVEKKEQPKKVIEQPKKVEIKQQKEKTQEKPEISKDELKEDTQYLLYCMVNANNNNNETSYEMYVSHLLDMPIDNPFKLGTNEYELFSTMQACWKKNPPNKRRSFVVGKQLCDLINNTEVEPEKQKQTILGVVPDEKKSWLKFLFPWKKDGELNDGAGSN